MSGVNDVYIVEAAAGGRKYVLKVYSFAWRDASQVRFELDLLAHLHRNGVAVSLPVPRRDGELLFPVPALEGERQAVLFEYALGRAPKWPFYEDEAESRLLGETLASLHNAADGFQATAGPKRMDEAFLLDAPLAAAGPFLSHRPEDMRYLAELVSRMRERLRRLASDGLSWGICHGDYHGGNVFIDDATGDVTVFDFDVCGEGWLAFDLARWRGDTEAGGGKEASWRAFLAGYTSRRPVSDADRRALPLFVALRSLDWMRVKASFVARGAWDTWDMDFFMNDLLSGLREREAQMLT